MGYCSLLDIMAEEDASLSLLTMNMSYCAPLEKILDELSDSIALGANVHSIYNMVLHPPRIIRAMINHKIDNPYNPEIKHLLNDAIETGLSVYNGDERASEKINSLRDRIVSSGNKELLEKQVHQQGDNVSLHSSRPESNAHTAETLLGMNDGRPVLFIAIAHGAVMPGMDIFLRYSAHSDSNANYFYPVRLSYRKWRDEIPRLSLMERMQLLDKGSNRTIVLFDEDRASGYTLYRAEGYFGEMFKENDIEVTCNNDARLEYKRRLQ